MNAIGVTSTFMLGFMAHHRRGNTCVVPQVWPRTVLCYNTAPNCTLNVHLSPHRVVCKMKGKPKYNRRKGRKKEPIDNFRTGKYSMGDETLVGVSWERWRMAMGSKYHMGKSETLDFSMVLDSREHSTFLSCPKKKPNKLES